MVNLRKQERTWRCRHRLTENIDKRNEIKMDRHADMKHAQEDYYEYHGECQVCANMDFDCSLTLDYDDGVWFCSVNMYPTYAMNAPYMVGSGKDATPDGAIWGAFGDAYEYEIDIDHSYDLQDIIEEAEQWMEQHEGRRFRAKLHSRKHR